MHCRSEPHLSLSKAVCAREPILSCLLLNPAPATPFPPASSKSPSLCWISPVSVQTCHSLFLQAQRIKQLVKKDSLLLQTACIVLPFQWSLWDCGLPLPCLLWVSFSFLLTHSCQHGFHSSAFQTALVKVTTATTVGPFHVILTIHCTFLLEPLSHWVPRILSIPGFPPASLASLPLVRLLPLLVLFWLLISKPSAFPEFPASSPYSPSLFWPHHTRVIYKSMHILMAPQCKSQLRPFLEPRACTSICPFNISTRVVSRHLKCHLSWLKSIPHLPCHRNGEFLLCEKS